MRSGLTWTILGAVGGKLFSIFVFVFIARYLYPEDFGAFAIATVIVGCLKIIVESGYKDAIIYFQVKDLQSLSDIFTLILVASMMLFILLNVYIIDISQFMGGGISEILFYLSFSLIFSPIRIVTLATIEQAMLFHTIVQIEFVSLVLSSIIGMTLAYLNYGVMSLVLMTLSNQLFQIISLFKKSHFRHSGIFGSMSNLNAINGYSIHLILIGVVNYISENLDRIIVGRAFDKTDVGLYDRSLYLSQMPAMLITTAISRVFFPKMSENKDSLKVIRTLHLNSLPIICFVGFPFLGALCLFSQEIINAVLGIEWIEMSGLLSVMAIIGMLRIIGFYNSNIYKALGETKLQNKINLLLKSILVISIFIGAAMGLLELAYSILIARLINLMITMYTVSRIIELSLWYTVRLPLLIMVYLFSYMMLFNSIEHSDYGSPGFSSLVIEFAEFIFIYFLVGIGLFSQIFKKLIREIKESIA